MSVMIFNIFVLRKYRLIFELCDYSILFLSTPGVVSVKTGGDQFAVKYKLKSVTLLFSTNGFFVLVLRIFSFHLFLIIIGYFRSSFCLLDKLSHY